MSKGCQSPTCPQLKSCANPKISICREAPLGCAKKLQGQTPSFPQAAHVD